MVKMPEDYKLNDENGQSNEKNELPQDKVIFAITLLKRFCFLGSFDPVNCYRFNKIELTTFEQKLMECCALVEPAPMLKILKTAYDSTLYRRDEVNLVYAAYLLTENVPIKQKTELRNHFPTLVQSDSDLFMFCKYAALLHHEKKKSIFCKTIKKAITSWYNNQTAENMANLFAGNRGKHGFTHRALIKLCHISDSVLGTKYLYHSLNNSCTELLKNADKPLPPPPTAQCENMTYSIIKEKIQVEIEGKNGTTEIKAIVSGMANVSINASTSQQTESKAVTETKVCDPEKIRSIVLTISKLRTTTDANEALKLVKEHNIKYEQLPYHLLQFPAVLQAVAPSISCLTLINCFNSEKIRKHFSKQEILKIFKEKFQKRGGLKNEHIDPILFLMNMDKLAISEPLKPTNNKKTSRGRLVQFSKQLFKNSFWEMQPTNLRIHITLNLQQNYLKKKLTNTKSINYQFASVALAFALYKAEDNCNVMRWGAIKLMDVDWDKKMDFMSAYNACSQVQNAKNKQRLYWPILHANETNKIYDLFIVIVPSATRGNSRNTSQILANYINEYRKKHNCTAKFVIVNLMRFKKSMKYSQTYCENILEICGLDEHTLPLILNYAQGRFD